MTLIGSWIRESDEANFQRFFDARPDVQLVNARVGREDFANCDGLLITGGPDISAEFLNQPVADLRLVEEPDPVRDAWEFAAVRSALDSGKPVFAICKGHQVLNVALGGTLLLDIPGHRDPEARLSNIQPLRYAGDAERRFERVNSSHHQAIERLGDGLEIEAWCAEDDIIEQVRLRNYPFALGVQFHPERDLMYAPLFEEFIEAATGRKKMIHANSPFTMDAIDLDLTVRCGLEFVYEASAVTPMFLLIKPRLDTWQYIEKEQLVFAPRLPSLEYEDHHGNIVHRVNLPPGRTTIRHDAFVSVPSAPENSQQIGPPVPVAELSANHLRYTLPSRDRDSDRLMNFAFENFGKIEQGVARVQAICDWLHRNIEYRFGSGDPHITASEVIARRYGVCRDFAHTAIALCRTFNIPARYVTGYVPDIGYQDPGSPMDFHAYFQAYIGHRWHTFDARFNVPRIGRIKIACGLDAVDGAFATAYGAARLASFNVWAYQVDPREVQLGDPIDMSKRLDGTPEVRWPSAPPDLLVVNAA